MLSNWSRLLLLQFEYKTRNTKKKKVVMEIGVSGVKVLLNKKRVCTHNAHVNMFHGNLYCYIGVVYYMFHMYLLHVVNSPTYEIYILRIEQCQVL